MTQRNMNRMLVPLTMLNKIPVRTELEDFRDELAQSRDFGMAKSDNWQYPFLYARRLVTRRLASRPTSNILDSGNEKNLFWFEKVYGNEELVSVGYARETSSRSNIVKP